MVGSDCGDDDHVRARVGSVDAHLPRGGDTRLDHRVPAPRPDAQHRFRDRGKGIGANQREWVDLHAQRGRDRPHGGCLADRPDDDHDSRPPAQRAAVCARDG